MNETKNYNPPPLPCKLNGLSLSWFPLTIASDRSVHLQIQVSLHKIEQSNFVISDNTNQNNFYQSWLDVIFLIKFSLTQLTLNGTMFGKENAVVLTMSQYLFHTLIMEGTCQPGMCHLTLTPFSPSSDFNTFRSNFCDLVSFSITMQPIGSLHLGMCHLTINSNQIKLINQIFCFRFL